MDCQKQANDFLRKAGIRYSSRFIKFGYHFQDDDKMRDIFQCYLSRPGKKMSIRFGQSLQNSTNGNYPPTAYDLLTCLTKYEPGTFNNFCGDYGYDNDSRRAEKTYKAVIREWNKVNSFFSSDELTELQEIN